MFEIASNEAQLRLHQESRHAKAKVEECFPEQFDPD
jgi:hypothetical protein